MSSYSVWSGAATSAGFPTTGRSALFIFDNMVRTKAPKDMHWTATRGPRAFWHYSFARRPPIFVLTFDAGLLTFRQKSPSCAPLSQLPPL
jgi:hypothetical protein